MGGLPKALQQTNPAHGININILSILVRNARELVIESKNINASWRLMSLKDLPILNSIAQIRRARLNFISYEPG